MKRKHFYSTWAKTLTTAILLLCGGITGICAGWTLTWLMNGMTLSEVIHPVSYVDSQTVLNYLDQELNSQLTYFSSNNEILNGKSYDGSMTVDISKLSEGVDAADKNANLEYTLESLENFYQSDGYPLLCWLMDDKGAYVYDEYDAYMSQDEMASASSEETTTTEPTTESATQDSAQNTNDTTNATDPQVYDIKRLDVSDWFAEEDDGDDLPDRHPNAYESYQIKCYNDVDDVLYGNGIDIEEKFVKPVSGMTLAAFTRTNGEANMLGTYYEDLLDAARTVHHLVNQKQVPTNAYVYLMNADDGRVYTNVPAWNNQEVSFAQLVPMYLSQDYSSAQENQKLYLSIDQTTGKVTSSRSMDYLEKDTLTNIKNELGDGTWKVFLGLDTNYTLHQSVSYRNSVMYDFYKNVSDQIALGSGEPLNIFVVMWIFAALTVVMLVMVSLQTGHRPEDDEIHPVLMDRFPIELLMIKDLILWTLLFTLYGMSLANSFESFQNHGAYNFNGSPQAMATSMAICAVIGVLAAALFAWDLKTYGRRIKEKKLGGSIFGGITHTVKKTVDASRKTIQESYRAKKANKQLLIAYVALLGAQTIFMLIICACGFNNFIGMALIFFLLMLLFDLFVYLKMLKGSSGKEAIIDGIQQLAAGNLDYRINTEHMSGENLELAREINKVRDGVEKAVDDQMKSERLKTDLITNVSHDIKTPLTSIINYVDILKRENIQDERIAGYIEILNKKALRLKQLTEDLVEASKISSGNITLTMQEINLKQLIKQTNGEFEEKFEARNLELICDLPEEQMLIEADGRRMFRVIENLYNNAAKYAMPSSRVYVNGSIEGDRVVFSMKNMSESPLNFKADELLERFVRGDVSRSTEGSGLGLEIARNLTMMQGGTFDLYLDGDLFKVTITFQKMNKKVKSET